MAELETGRVIAGKYRLENRLDAGGRAQVWSATDTELDRLVALKILVTPGAGDEAFVDAFRQEAQVEAGLEHPSIVQVFDWGHEENLNFVVMEFLDGTTAHQALASQGIIAWERVLSAGRQLSSALAYAHNAEVAHGHVSADRIMLAPDGHATLVAFGLRCRGGCEVVATPDADTFALGGVLYEMLTGSSPFAAPPAEHPADQPWPEPVRQLVPAVPHELDRIVMKAIAADPAQRYHTAAELQADLDALAKPKSRAWLWWTLAVLAVIVVGVATWYFASQQKVVVPDVVDLTQTQAQATLAKSGLKLVLAGQSPSSIVPTGSVVAEKPQAGVAVRKGSEVGVTISSGVPMVSMPSVVGQNLSAASSAISSAGLILGDVTHDNNATYPADTVISASQAAGASIPEGTRIDLVVSLGLATVVLPDVRSTSQADATAKLQALGLTVSVGRVYSSQSSGLVVAQGPAPGTTINKGGTVTISVSRGPAPVKVPNVVGATSTDARNTLTELGLVPVIASTEASGTEPTRLKGKVVEQSPSSGSGVAPGSRVDLTIGN